MSDCLFCKLISGEIPSNKIRETDDIFAFRDINPQAPQHILIVPKKHIAKLADTSASDRDILGTLLFEATRIAGELGMNESGYRIVINNGEQAGQSVWHIHVHLLSGRPFHWPPG